jgi:putative transcriptional regulator
MTSLAPSLLLSMPQLLDPNFVRTVVLLCRHTEEGAFGIVVNRPAVATGRMVIDGDPPVSFEGEMRVWMGGPVDPARSWVLVGTSPGSDGIQDSEPGLSIADGLHLSASPDLLRRLFEPNPPSRARLVVGYSGWSAGQLEAELEESSWLLSDVDPALIFDTEPEEMWEAAIRRLGADPNALHMSRGVH